MKYSTCLCGLLILALCGGVVLATPIQWVLPPASLVGCCGGSLGSQSATVSGHFVFDALTSTYSDWNFQISGFTVALLPLNGVLTPGNSNVVTGGPTMLHLAYASAQAHLVLTYGYLTTFGLLPVPLTDAGGTVETLISDSASFVSFYATGRGEVSSVPEPAAGALVLMGAAALCFWKKGQRTNKPE